jgi:hypothetical protein
VPTTSSTQPDFTWNNAGGTENAVYYYFGFAFLQDLVERAYAELRKGGDIGQPGVYGQMFPVPAFRDDIFAWGISRSVPLFLVLAWIYFISMLTKNIVYEKEHRLKEVNGAMLETMTAALRRCFPKAAELNSPFLS